MVVLFLCLLIQCSLSIEYFPSHPYIKDRSFLLIPYVLNTANISNEIVDDGNIFDCSERILNMTLLGDSPLCQWIVPGDTNLTSKINISLGSDSVLLHHEKDYIIHFQMKTSDVINTINVEGVCPANYFGENCQVVYCGGISSKNSTVCNGGGACISHNRCRCHGSDLSGIYCDETIKEPFYNSKKEIWIPYFAKKKVLESLNSKTSALFHCSNIIKDYHQFGVNSRCQISSSESNILLTDHLVIYNVPGDIEEVTIIPVTGGDERTFLIDQYDTNIFQEARLILIFVGAGIWVHIMACCFCCCICCICCCFGTVIPCLCCYMRKHDVRYKRIKKIEDIDLIMKEKESEKGDGAHLSINKNSFKIKFDDINIMSTIGAGGSDCIVFKTKWKGKTVAFKCFKTKDILKTQNKYNEFEREVEILGSVSHPYVLRFYGASLKPPRVGILMEYCKEGDLKKFFKSSDGLDFSLAERLRVLREITAAMQYLHSKNIIHRDLKCENVLLDCTFSVRVMDFGMARIVKKIQEAKTSRIGTSNYMAPEVVFGQKYDQKCDVFSFGILMWEVLTGNFDPYEHLEDKSHIEIKVANDPNLRPPVNIHPLSMNPWLVVLVTESFSHDATSRPSFEEIHDTFVKEKSIRKKQALEENLLLRVDEERRFSQDDDGLVFPPPQATEREKQKRVFTRPPLNHAQSTSILPVTDTSHLRVQNAPMTPMPGGVRKRQRSRSVFLGGEFGGGGEGGVTRRRTRKAIRQLSSINEGKIRELKKRHELLADRMEEYEKVRLENEALKKEVQSMTGNAFSLWQSVKNRMVGKRGSLMWKLDQLNLLNENTRLSTAIRPDDDDSSASQNNNKKKKGLLSNSLRGQLKKITEGKDLIAKEERENVRGMGVVRKPKLKRKESSFKGMFKRKRENTTSGRLKMMLGRSMKGGLKKKEAVNVGGGLRGRPIGVGFMGGLGRGGRRGRAIPPLLRKQYSGGNLALRKRFQVQRVAELNDEEESEGNKQASLMKEEEGIGTQDIEIRIGVESDHEKEQVEMSSDESTESDHGEAGEVLEEHKPPDDSDMEVESKEEPVKRTLFSKTTEKESFDDGYTK